MGAAGAADERAPGEALIDDRSSFAEVSTACVAAGLQIGCRVERLPNGAPVLVREGAGPMLSLLAGLHGDERSGPIFLARLLQRWAREPRQVPYFGLVVVPLVNHDGWEREQRLCAGIDLNRAFTTPSPSPIVAALLEHYRSLPIGLHWDIHEDANEPDAFVFRYLHDRHLLSERIAARWGAPLEPWEAWDTSSECFVRGLGVERAVTTELPPGWPLDRRLERLGAALEVVCTEMERLDAGM